MPIKKNESNPKKPKMPKNAKTFTSRVCFKSPKLPHQNTFEILKIPTTNLVSKLLIWVKCKEKKMLNQKVAQNCAIS